MKNLIIAVLVVVIVLSLGIYEQVFEKTTLSEVIKISDSIIAYLKSDDIPKAKVKVNELNNYWQSHRIGFELLYTHSEFRDIPLLIGELMGNIDVEDKNQAIVRANIIKEDAINHMNKLSFKIENIL